MLPTSLVIALAAHAVPPTLQFNGVCPGVVDVMVSDATPQGNVVILTADAPGSWTMNAGPCRGIDTGLSASGIKVRVTERADDYGYAERNPDIPDAPCHSWVQVVDIQSCTLTQAIPLPWDADHDGHASISTGGDDCDDTDPDIYPGNLDLPDENFIDANCDGIDGSVLDALFVATTGADFTGCSIDLPCLTIEHALTAAESRGITEIDIQTGTYPGVLDLRSLALHGGYDANWDRDLYSQAGHTVTLTGGTSTDNQPMVLRARNGDLATISNLVLDAPDATDPGQSSYAVHAVASTVILSQLQVIQGDGISGTVGSTGPSGSASPAPRGGSGCNGESFFDCCDTDRECSGGGANNTSCGGTVGGTGGQGGQMDTSCDWLGCCDDCDATSGLSGSNAAVYDATLGRGGSGGSTCNGGNSGTDGMVVNGAGGVAILGHGMIASDFWSGDPGGTGGWGDHGGGGGGAGGSGGCDAGTDDRGAGGGGGGAGGCRADPGAGGTAGGGSFGVFAVSSTLDVRNVSFEGGNGGNGGHGGDGGAGQQGGAGGYGGNGTADSPDAGDGGDGGHGGHGGGGAGGNGGVVSGLFIQGTVLQESNNTFSVGVGGAGGLGGTSAPGWIDGNDGQAGAAGSVGFLITCASQSDC